ncbi:MAG: DUF1579 family protein [Proteobacteria bacterium]|nr:DUF1579 family protein [Pseudomonadota bacterium]
MKKSRFLFPIALLLLSPAIYAVSVPAIHAGLYPSERHARMAELDYLVGIWEMTSRETISGGQYAEATGIRSCVWVLDRTAIRCDDMFTHVRATSGFPGLYEPRDRLFYVTFNEQDGNYEFLYMSAVSAEKNIFPAEFDIGSKTLLHEVPGEFLGHAGETMQSTWQKLIDDNQIREEYKTISDDGDTMESVEITLRRMVGGNRDGLFF